MNYLDVIIAIPLLYGAWKGYQRGLVFEIAMILGLLLGIYIAFKFLNFFEQIVSKYISGSGNFLPYLTFILVFISVMVLMIMLAKMLEAILKITALNVFNKIGGALIGVIKFALVISFMLSLLKPVDLRLGLISQQAKNESKFYKRVLNISNYLFPALQDVKEEFQHRIGK